jgi:hypothetical protein
MSADGLLRTLRRYALRGLVLLLFLFGVAAVAGVIVGTLVSMAEQLSELGHAALPQQLDP